MVVEFLKKMQHTVDLIRLSKSRINLSTRNTSDGEDLARDKANTHLR